MPTQADLEAALKRVLDPELNMPITDLGMVKFAEASGSSARVQIDLTVDGCPLKDQILKDTNAALKSVGFESTEVKLGVMSAAELDALKQRLGKAKAAQINPSAGSGPGGPGTAGKLAGDAGGINRLPKKVPNLIAISSGKGGVGKSSVTSQLAVALRRQGLKVGILDADITGPSIARIFGVTERPKVEGNDTLLPVASSAGVDILSMNLMITDEKAPVIWRGPMINGAIRQLYANARWEGHDVLLVDLPPGTSDATLTVFQSLPLDGVIIVSTPQALVGMIVAKSVRMAEILHIPILGLIENYAYVQPPGLKEPYYLFGKPKGEALSKEYGFPYLGALPIRPELADACDQGKIKDFESPEMLNIAKAIMKSRLAAK